MEKIINIEDSVIKHSHQDTVSHILVVHQWQVCLMHNLSLGVVLKFFSASQQSMRSI